MYVAEVDITLVLSTHHKWFRLDRHAEFQKHRIPTCIHEVRCAVSATWAHIITATINPHDVSHTFVCWNKKRGTAVSSFVRPETMQLIFFLFARHDKG